MLINLFSLTTIKTMPFILSSHSQSVNLHLQNQTPFFRNFMSFLHMGFPPKKDAIDSKNMSSETTEMSDGGSAVFGANGSEESATDFWPIQHPIEPPQGDKPVECPLPHSSVINDWRLFGRSFHRKVAEPTSKRRHSVSHGGDYYRYRTTMQPFFNKA